MNSPLNISIYVNQSKVAVFFFAWTLYFS